jgi:hypothetical protein
MMDFSNKNTVEEDAYGFSYRDYIVQENTDHNYIKVMKCNFTTFKTEVRFRA